MSKKILIIFWGNPLYDGRCMNMINQISNTNQRLYCLGIGEKYELIKNKNYNLELMSNIHFQNPLTKYFNYFEKIKKNISKINPDIVIAADLYSMIPAAKIKKIYHYSLIYDSRELYTKLGALRNKPIIQFIWNYYEKKYIYTVDCTLVTADIDKNYLVNIYGKIKIKLFKNLPGNHFLSSKTFDLKKELCLSQNKKILLYQGKLHYGRGIRFVIECMKNMKNVVLVIIGDGPMKEIYIKSAKKYNLEDKLYFIDAVPYLDLAKYSSSAYIGLSVIQPISKSYENALPNKLFEYSVSGLPFICSNLTAMQKAVNELKSGIAIQHNNHSEFINAYEKISSNYDDFVIDKEKRMSLLWDQNNNLSDVING